MHRLMAIIPLLVGVACASSQDLSPLGASPVTPGAGEQVIVDHAYLVIDSSRSVDTEFAREKALVRSFVGVMPEGTYQTGAVAFGGYARQAEPLSPFNRASDGQYAANLDSLKEGTPLDRVLIEVAENLGGRSGRAAVVIFSDGLPTDPVGREIDKQSVLVAAALLADSYDGEVCIHTVQVGDDPAGAAFLSELAGTSPCGSARSASSIQNVAALQGFGRQVFLGGAETRSVAAAPRDSDGDGVIDERDACPGTPLAARVDARGCWVLNDLNFAFDSSTIEPKYFAELDELARVLQRNPGLKVRLDGFTDSTGPAAYNKGLSQRRADAVRAYLINKGGVDGSRIETRGFGDENPVAPNTSAANRALNRRTEITPI